MDGSLARDKVHSTINVISAYPYEFVANHTFEIEGWRIDPDAPYTILTYEMLHLLPTGSSSTYTYNRREAIYIYWDDSDRPAAPTCQFVYDADSGKVVLSGADSSMEYRLKSQTSKDWVPFTDEPVYFDSPNYGAGTVYYVRYAAKDGEQASQTQEIVLPAKQSAPSVKYREPLKTVNWRTSLSTKEKNGSI